MKKMLAKAVALSLVLGGVGFVANNAQAATIGDGVKVHSATVGVDGYDVKTENKLQNGTVLAEQKDLAKVNKDAEFAKAVATKAYGMAQTEQVDRKVADAQIREDMKKADKDLSDKIDANAKNIATNKTNIQQNATAILVEKKNRESAVAMVDNQVKLEKQERENADKKLATDILVEKKNRESAVAMVDNKVNLERQERENADKKLATDILVEKKNRESAVAMVDNKVNLEKQERENNDAKLDAKIDKETKAREFGEFKLNTKIDAEGQARVENDKILNAKIDKETNDREMADTFLNIKVNAEGEARVAGDELLNNKINAETDARVDADKKLNAKIDSNAAKVQEQLDAQDNKNKAQDASIKANGQAIAANKDAIKANADAIKANKAEADEQHKYLNSRIENNTANIDKNKVAIENETQARVDADKKLDQKITDEAKAREDADKAEAKAREDADKAEAAAREAADKVLDGKIADEAKTRADEDARIEAKFDGEVSRLDGRINQLDARVEKVGAMAAAIANLHTMGYDPEAPTEIAVGVGQYRDKTGMALGAFHYPNRDFMLSFSVSTAGDEFMGGIGATWKFGRKSPEELRQAEAEKAAKAKLAKAEAAKKAAKDARVAAQQKRHAEMLAARTGK